MSSAEVVGYIIQLNQWDKIEDTAEKLAREARSRWQELNKVKKNNNKIGDYPSARHGIDDITVIILYLDFTSDNNYGIYEEEAKTTKKEDKKEKKEGSKERKKKTGTKKDKEKVAASQPPPANSDRKSDGAKVNKSELL
jgi:hypothetical protein